MQASGSFAFPRDSDEIERVLKWWRPFLRVFVAPVEGIENLPDGPVFLVANHNIGAAFEVIGLLNAWEEHFNRKRPIYALAHKVAFHWLAFGKKAWAYGAVPATYDSADRVFALGGALLVFPGGNYEAVRPFTQRRLCDFGGHLGWAKIAITNQVPVVPVAITHSHKVNPVLVRSRLLSIGLGLPWLLGVKYFPLSLSQIVYTSFFSMMLMWSGHALAALVSGYFVFMISPLWPSWIPWRDKIRIRILPKMVPASQGENRSPEQLYEAVISKIQLALLK